MITTVDEESFVRGFRLRANFADKRHDVCVSMSRRRLAFFDVDPLSFSQRIDFGDEIENSEFVIIFAVGKVDDYGGGGCGGGRREMK